MSGNGSKIRRQESPIEGARRHAAGRRQHAVALCDYRLTAMRCDAQAQGSSKITAKVQMRYVAPFDGVDDLASGSEAPEEAQVRARKRAVDGKGIEGSTVHDRWVWRPSTPA